MTNMIGKKAIVIGGTSGIGAAVADALASRGAEVVRASRATGLDVSDGAALTSWIADQGPVDHLVFTAGSQAPGGAIASLDLDAARAAFDIKFWGSIRAAQAVAPNLREGGTITFTSGFLARRTVPGTFIKTAINAALEASTKILAKELAPIRVNVVSPGLTDTEAYANMEAGARKQMLDGAASRLPAGRVAQPQDVAAGHLFAIETPSVTGAVIDIDGGALIN
ncbi:SDR family oxidoreductase [Tritonibacter mobilis]|uniref:Dehydrogenase n=1 Tax=Tritonibacter mobilis F1926 TaxID=1265309 RepID=A0A1B1A724_9RHOB|nr:SDR family oxidoreductase [Tritonibacter mobilis]ANP42379.1 dehydrogenase [Tritonibacter mobilis F1926]KJZ22697.1 dehydrogenase [Tritonibacter mobilis]